MNRPSIVVILAMTADGKIADFQRSPARFGSDRDKKHLEQQISLVDAVLFGAGTLRAYQTTLPVSDSLLIEARRKLGKAPQPVQIVCSITAKIDPEMRFFRQPVPRWLLTTDIGAQFWQSRNEFEKIVVAQKSELNSRSIDWHQALAQLTELGMEKIAVLGGGELVASLFAEDVIDELWLTVCPIILAGKSAPTPVEGIGFTQERAKKLELLSIETVDREIFLHYRVSTQN